MSPTVAGTAYGERFAPTMDLDDALKLLEEAGSKSDPIFYKAVGATEASETDAEELADMIDGEARANGIRIQYFGCTLPAYVLRKWRSECGRPGRPVVLCEGTLYDMVLERHGLAPGAPVKELPAPGTANAARRAKTKVRRTIKTTVVTTQTFTATEIRAALGLPRNAVLSVHVPGGGDWSNDDLELGDVRGVVLDVKIETTEESEG